MTTRPLRKLMKIKAGERSRAHNTVLRYDPHPRVGTRWLAPKPSFRCSIVISARERHISRQREIIDRLIELGAPAEQALELLDLFRVTQALHIAHRERLLD